MTLLSNAPATLFPPERAEEIARDLRAADEDGWTFTAVHEPKGIGASFVEIRDEAGELLGKL